MNPERIYGKYIKLIVANKRHSHPLVTCGVNFLLYHFHKAAQSFQDTTTDHQNNNGSVIQTATAAPVLGLELVLPSSQTQLPRRERKRKKRSRPEGVGEERMVGREILRPSMPMALAIVYSSCRWLRNGIVPIDLVRLCR